MDGADHHRRAKTIAGILWLLLSASATIALSNKLWPEEEQRLNVGIHLFPACLNADLSLSGRVTPNGALRILVVHDQDPVHAETAAAGLRELHSVGGYPLKIDKVSLASLVTHETDRISALFIATPGIQTDIFDRWAREHQVMVFSPFAGDVERGAVAGLYVSDRILPLVNLSQAERAGIRFKPFFLRIARHHDE
ncbi:MAG: YfiR family protein [Candidatus Thiodiazotropha sp. (ex Dulcina madagascariensis)]|nr:YfiR family protein [Candidatus Thiodiazotropha sp. (ex Dulcina madagascariensis)]MCU7925488.1 YfiR family protein [Candidatus Thiodiazotropha sp. (ex Dulcina madagascariensis)]